MAYEIKNSEERIERELKPFVPMNSLPAATMQTIRNLIQESGTEELSYEKFVS